MGNMKALIYIIIFSALNITIPAEEIVGKSYMDAYVVIVDSSQSYSKLHKEMCMLQEKLNIEIDTMGRGFDIEQNFICLPEDAEDGIYAGSYIPRRSQSETLSLEYLNFYVKNDIRLRGTIALVAMITSDKEQAEKRLKKIQKYSRNVYIQRAKISYMCMH